MMWGPQGQTKRLENGCQNRTEGWTWKCFAGGTTGTSLTPHYPHGSPWDPDLPPRLPSSGDQDRVETVLICLNIPPASELITEDALALPTELRPLDVVLHKGTGTGMGK